MGGIGIGQEGWGWWTVSEGEGLTTVFALGCVCASCQGALMASSRSCHCVAQVRKSSERRMGHWNLTPSPIPSGPSLHVHTPGWGTQQVPVVLPTLL